MTKENTIVPKQDEIVIAFVTQGQTRLIGSFEISYCELNTSTCSSGRVLCQLSLKEHQLVGVANDIQVLDMIVGDIEHRYKIQA